MSVTLSCMSYPIIDLPYFGVSTAGVLLQTAVSCVLIISAQYSSTTKPKPSSALNIL